MITKKHPKLIKKHPKLIQLIRICPGGLHAWYLADLDGQTIMVRKEIKQD